MTGYGSTRRGIANRVPLAAAVAAALMAAVVAAVLWTAAIMWLSTWPRTPDLSKFGAQQRLDILKISLTATAGIGGIVALTVAYRRQRVHEAAHLLSVLSTAREEVKLFNERFGSASKQMGDERPAVRLAGVYALAGLADDWEAGRQACIDVLCAYLRMPFVPETASEGESQVRRSMMRVISEHLMMESPVPWHDVRFDFSGALLEAVSFASVHFSAGLLLFFDKCTFTGDRTTFYNASFDGAKVYIRGATFTSPDVSFEACKFKSGELVIEQTVFRAEQVRFNKAKFGECRLLASAADFADSTLVFDDGVEPRAILGLDVAVPTVAFWPTDWWSPDGAPPPGSSPTPL